MGDGFYRSKDTTNSIKVLKEKTLQRKTQKKQRTQNTGMHTKYTIKRRQGKSIDTAIVQEVLEYSSEKLLLSILLSRCIKAFLVEFC